MLPNYPDVTLAPEAVSAVLGYKSDPAHAVRGEWTLQGIASSFWKPDRNPLLALALARAPMSEDEAVAILNGYANQPPGVCQAGGAWFLLLLQAAKVILDILNKKAEGG